MLAACLVLCAVAVHPGSVATLSASSSLVIAGDLNWVLQDRPIVVPDGTRALVVRRVPGPFVGVVEVRLLDGTNRLGWTAAAGLTAVAAPVAPRATAPNPAGPAGRTSIASSRSSARGVKSRSGQGRRNSWARYDALMSGLFQDALSGQGSGSSCSACASMPAALISPL